MKTIYRNVTIILVCAALGACASGPTTFADRVYAEGESKIAIAEQWERGNKAVAKGESRLDKGQKLVSKGRADLLKGEELKSSGMISVQSSRNAYAALASFPQVADNSAEVEELAVRLEKIAQTWKQGELELEKGNELLLRGNQRSAEGEAEIAAGQQLIESGRKLMRTAEQSYPVTASQ